MLTAGLRYETGGDWTSYTNIFETIEPIDQIIAGDTNYFDWMNIESGYKYLNSTIKFFVDNVQMLFFVVAVIISTFIFKGIRKYSPYPIMGVLIYFGILFFSLDMIVLRQGIAVAIIFWGYRYIEERKFWKYLLICLIAMQFHTSAIVALVVYFVCRPKYPTRVLVSAFIAFLAVFLLQIKWLSDIAVSLLSMQVDEDVAQKLIVYTTREAYSVSRGITFGLLANVAVFSVLMLYRKKLNEVKYFNLFLNIFMIYLLVYLCMSEFVEVGNRLKYYFMISLVVLIPQMVSVIKGYRLKLIGYAVACGFSMLYCRNIIFERPGGIAFNPYQNYIMHEMFQYRSDGKDRLDKSDKEFLKERGV